MRRTEFTLRELNLLAAYRFGLIDAFQYLELWRTEDEQA